MAFFGPGPSDIVCIGEGGQIRASGSLDEMRKLADEKNYAVARLTPLKYAIVPRHIVPFLTDAQYEEMVLVTHLTNRDLAASFESEPRPWTEIVKKPKRSVPRHSMHGTSSSEGESIVNRIRTGRL